MSVSLTLSPPLRRFLPLLSAVGFLILSVAVPVGRADDGAEQELQGIIPEFIPDGITEDDFAELNGNWTEWAEETGALVTDFYSSEDVNVIGRRATLALLQHRVETMKQALGDPQYRSIHLRLADYYGRLAPRVAILGALLDTIEIDLSAANESNVQSAMQELGERGESLRAHLNSVPQGDAWSPYFNLPEVIAAAEGQDAAENTIALLDEVQTKLAERTELSESQREFLSSEPFLAFEDSLSQTLSFVTMQNPDSYRDQMRALAAGLVEALEYYEEEPLSKHTRAIRTIYDDIRRLSPDGGARLSDAMRRFYLNYNLRAVVDESLAQSLFNESRYESGFINEMALGAHVTGCQWTNTNATIDFKPSDYGIRFNLGLQGNIRAKTQGETHLATVYVAGRHGFCGHKEILFDGYHFLSKPACVRVRANNIPTGANTHFSHVPLLGPLTESIAVKEARKKLPEANAIARRKIYQEAKPRFDREAYENFQKAELELETKVKGPLREEGLYPDVMQFTSTEHDAMARTRLMESGELGGGATFPIPLYPTHGVLVQIHESLLNNAAQRFELEGKTFTPDELKAYMGERLERLTGRPVDLGEILPEQSDDDATEDNPRIEAVEFANEDAIRFNIEGGVITLYLRIGLDLEGRDPIPPQNIGIKLAVSLTDAGLYIEPLDASVTPIGNDAPGSSPVQLGITRSKMRQALKLDENQEDRRHRLDTRYTFDLQEKRLTFDLTDLKARGGWLSFILTDGVTEGGSSVAHVPPHEPVPVLPVPSSGAVPQLAPEAAQDTVPVIQLDGIDGASQKAGNVATGPSLHSPIRR